MLGIDYARLESEVRFLDIAGSSIRKPSCSYCQSIISFSFGVCVHWRTASRPFEARGEKEMEKGKVFRGDRLKCLRTRGIQSGLHVLLTFASFTQLFG